jgi:peptide/nickel transport system substrate-binding protein
MNAVNVLRRFSGRGRIFLGLLAGAALVLACGPSQGPAREPGAADRLSGTKTLYIAMEEEPVTMLMYGRQGEGGTTTARYERFMTMQAQLTQYSDDLQPVAWAATKVPTIQDGDWLINPDGTMEVTWKIRPDVRWHDGQSLTAADFVLGMEMVRDPKLGVSGLGELTKITDVRAADPHTLVVTWRSISVQANTNFVEGVPAVPKHQVEDFYRSNDREAIEGSQLWRNELLGTGPYRLVEWDLGSSYTLQAFDQYFLGRPKIDRLIYTYSADPQMLVPRVLAGTVDLIPPGTAIKPTAMTAIKEQMGDRVLVMAAPNDHRHLTVNGRDAAAPWSDHRFRQAMLHGLNRSELADVVQLGWTDPTWYWGFPQDPVYRMAEQAGLPKYEFDPSRATQILASLGWTKGPDGILQNAAGEKAPVFVCCRLQSEQDSANVQESLAVNSYLRAIGIDAQHPVADPPAGMAGTAARQWNNTQRNWGGTFGNFRVTADQNWATFVAAQIPSADNGWNGFNTMAWRNDRYEDFFARAQSSLDPRERATHNFELMRIGMEQLPSLPVYYNPLGLVVRRGVEGVSRQNPLNRAVTFNIHEWDLRS